MNEQNDIKQMFESQSGDWGILETYGGECIYFELKNEYEKQISFEEFETYRLNMSIEKIDFQ